MVSLMPQVLRPDQLLVIDGVLDALRRVRRVGVRMPTGAGKTTVMAELAMRASAKGKTGWFLTHREEIAQQVADRLTGQGANVGVLMGTAASTRPEAPMQVLGVQTLANRIRSKKISVAPDVIIPDEAHHAASPTWRACVDWVLAVNERSRAVFFTATPWLSDGSGLGIATEWIDGLSPQELVKMGVLVPPRIFCGPAPDLTKVPSKGGDFSPSELTASMRHLQGDIVACWEKFAKNRSTLVFAASIAHSLELVMRFRAAGYEAAHVDAETPDDERAAIFARLRTGELKLVSNVGIVTEGFDCPSVDCVVLARATKSDILFLQMIGRALRSAPGKTDCIVIDHGRNAQRHGHPLAHRPFVASGKMARRKVTEEEVVDFDLEMKVCPKCARVNDVSRVTCLECGASLAPARIPRERTKLELVEFEELGLAMKEPAAIAQRRVRWQQIRATVRGSWPQSYAYAKEFGLMPHDDMILTGQERRRYFMERARSKARA